MCYPFDLDRGDLTERRYFVELGVDNDVGRINGTVGAATGSGRKLKLES
jgi:hypothetical protein